jgi:signal transduction histidine kinase
VLGRRDGTDSLISFSQAILVVRWCTTAAVLVLASPDLSDGDDRLILAGAALLAYTLYRAVRPIGDSGPVPTTALVLLEAAAMVLVVGATGYWDSPLTLALLPAVAVAGFARGFGFGVAIALVANLGVSIPWLVEGGVAADHVLPALQWSVEVLLVALVAAYARRISFEATERRNVALDRVGRLSDANALLFQLHHVTQTLPASLDLAEVLDVTLAQLCELFEHEAVALLLLDDADQQWHVVRRHGGQPPGAVPTEDLPAPLARALRLQSVVSEEDLHTSGGPGVTATCSSGLYTVLSARGATIGLISVEHGDPSHYGQRDADLLSGFVESAALAVDNARWFGRIRTLGADEERTRIARDLHDRIGQSLAYLAFELDRIVKRGRQGADMDTALDELRTDVRGVIREVRDTLYDLRTDVTDSQSLAETLGGFLGRIRERGGLEVRLHAEETGRLAILQERELWRIAQEAVTNVVRHARATLLEITWECDGEQGMLEVVDDGIGFPAAQAAGLDSFGLLGMRERAASIGAVLVVDSEPGRGTRVRCTLGA